MDKVYLLFAIAAPLRIWMCAGKPDGTRFVHLAEDDAAATTTTPPGNP